MKLEIVTISIDGVEIAPFKNSLALLEVSLRYEEASQFRLILSIAVQQDGSWPSLDDSAFGLLKKIEISAGFDDQLEKLFTGYITHIRPRFGNSPSSCSLEISGYDETILLDREDTCKIWKNKSDSAIASEIFNIYGFDFEADDTKTVHDEAVSSIVQRESDMQFLKRLSARNGYECYIVNSKAYFGKSKLNEKPQPILAVQFGSQTTVNNFTINVNGLRPSLVAVSQFERLTKNILVVESKIEGQTQLGDHPFKSSIPVQTSECKVQLTRNPSTGSQEMSALVNGIAESSEWFVTGEGEIAGNLYEHILRPYAPVTIKGVGETYSGKYYVTDVTHIFTKDGYYQRFRVVRNGTGLRGDEVF